MENTATIDLELYDEFKKAIDFFEVFRQDNHVLLNDYLNFKGNISKIVITSDEAVKVIADNLNKSMFDNRALRGKIETLESEIKVLKENKYPWYKRIF